MSILPRVFCATFYTKSWLAAATESRFACTVNQQRSSVSNSYLDGDGVVRGKRLSETLPNITPAHIGRVANTAHVCDLSCHFLTESTQQNSRYSRQLSDVTPGL